MYTTNPFLPRARMMAVNQVRAGWSIRQTARWIGVHPSTVSRWLTAAPDSGNGTIPTRPSRPRTNPNRISLEIRRAIARERRRHGRCGQVVHQELLRQGVNVSLATVQRELSRQGLIRKRSPWKRRHQSLPRPIPAEPGDLVALDTIHHVFDRSKRLYVYTLIDVCSRWAHAWVSPRISARASLTFLAVSRERALFPFRMLQSDHGSEFSTHFSERCRTAHRHTRVRTPNDQAHLERFNRTIQEECLDREPTTLAAYRRVLPGYLRYYNEERLHMGIDYQTPAERIRQLLPRS